MTLEVRPAPHGAADISAAETALIDDRLGLARYLADSVGGGDETTDAMTRRAPSEKRSKTRLSVGPGPVRDATHQEE